MRLRVSTPSEVVLDADDVRHVRAEDETGAFGVLPGHAPLVAVLVPSVLTWRDGAGRDHHVAVRGGVLVVVGGAVEVATREAHAADALAPLERIVRERFRAEEAAESAARGESLRLQAAAIRQLARALAGAAPVRRVADGGRR